MKEGVCDRALHLRNEISGGSEVSSGWDFYINSFTAQGTDLFRKIKSEGPRGGGRRGSEEEDLGRGAE